MQSEIKKLCKKIKLIILDVDGVLTNGKIIISSSGEESKAFCVEDGTGAAIAHFALLPFIFLSGRYSKSTEIRAKELKAKDCFQNVLDKKNKLNEIRKKLNIQFSEIAYAGDGLVDIPALEAVGLPISVPNAHEGVKEKAKYITKSKGGDGVFQEIVELILINQDRYEDTINIMKKKIFKV